MATPHDATVSMHDTIHFRCLNLDIAHTRSELVSLVAHSEKTIATMGYAQWEADMIRAARHLAKITRERDYAKVAIENGQPLAETDGDE